MGIDHRQYAGPKNLYDTMAGLQFCYLFNLGMRANHILLDFGCGVLKFGRLAIQYLSKEKYYGIEPEKELVNLGIKRNYLEQIIDKKKATFKYNDNCDLSVFDKQFDFIIAQSVFSHLPWIKINKAFQTACKAMHKDTIFIATGFVGDKDNQETGWSSKAEYKESTFKELANDAGLKLKLLDWYHPKEQTWMEIKK